MVWQVRLRPDNLWLWSQSLLGTEVRVSRVCLLAYHVAQRLDSRTYFQRGRNAGNVEGPRSPRYDGWSGLRCQVSAGDFHEEDVVSRFCSGLNRMSARNILSPRKMSSAPSYAAFLLVFAFVNWKSQRLFPLHRRLCCIGDIESDISV